MTSLLTPLKGRYWRMLHVRWQREPFVSGSHLTGGRWNRPGTRALYLGRSYNTAIAEAYQDLVRPATLVGYDVTASAVIDLTDPAVLDAAEIDPMALWSEWKLIYKLQHATPPTWPIADRLIAAGAEGALVPSAQDRGGVNLVLWCWHASGEAGEGAALTLLDPDRVLAGERG